MNTKENLENLFSAAGSTAERLWEISLLALGSLAWNQEQVETLISKYLEQSKSAREEATKFAEELMNQAKRNQQQIQQMIEESVVGAFSKLDIPTFSYINNLGKKVDDLSQKVADL